MTAALAISPLHIERASPAGARGATAIDAGRVIGGLHYGLACSHAGPGVLPAVAETRLAPVPAPLLGGTLARVDRFLGRAVEAEGHCGQVRWCHDGHWLFGQVELAESAAAFPSDAGPVLETIARLAYGDIFETLAGTGFSHLQRLWNYVPRINEDGGGMERYRQFNSGRQRAFLDAGRAAFEGAPAACALGIREGPLCVHFLAGHSRPLAVENPRQVSAYRYPTEFGPRSPSFSRAALTDAGDGRVALLISGTASIVGHQSLHIGDVRAQAREALVNLGAVMAAARTRCDAAFALPALQCVIYLRKAADQATVREVLEAELGRDAALLRDAVWLQADICRRELLVEIEGHAVLPGRLNPLSSGHRPAATKENFA